MAKLASGGGANKLTKLKSVLKKMQSFGKLSRAHSSSSAIAAASTGHSSDDDYNNNNNNNNSSSSISRVRDGHDLGRPVLVGKSRRRYLVNSDLIDHPIFRELVERPGGQNNDSDNDEGDILRVRCEVVLFEHLLWMLENADPQPESLDDLVDFYATC